MKTLNHIGTSLLGIACVLLIGVKSPAAYGQAPPVNGSIQYEYWFDTQGNIHYGPPPEAQQPPSAPVTQQPPSAPSSSGFNAVQQMQLNTAYGVGQQVGNALGQAIGKSIHDSLYNNNGTSQAQLDAQQQQALQAQRAQQQRELAAQQLNNNGVYLLRQRDYAGAIIELQQALSITPSDKTIINNLRYAKQLQEQARNNAAAAAQNSGTLGQLLGNASTVSSPNSSALKLVNLDSNPNVVDLRGTTKTYVDPALVKGDSVNQPSDVQQAVRDLDNLLDNSAGQAKKQLDDVANNYLPHAAELNGAQSAPVAQPEIQNPTPDAGQTAKNLDQALGQNQNADATQTPGQIASGNQVETVSANPATQQPNSQSAPVTQPEIQNPTPDAGQTAKNLDQALGQNQNADATQTPGQTAPGNQLETVSANPATQQPNSQSAPVTQPEIQNPTPDAGQTAKNLDQASDQPSEQPNANNPPNTKSSALGQLASVAGNSSGFDGGSGSTLNTSTTTMPSDPNLVDLQGKAGTVDPSILKGRLSDPTFSAPGTPLVTTTPTKNHYQIAAGYNGPISSSGPPQQPQGASNPKLASFQNILDAMYAADCSYTADKCPRGYQILQRFTLASNGTEAVLYGQLNDAGNPAKLILAFRGTTQDLGNLEINDWTYGNLANGAPGLLALCQTNISSFDQGLGITATILAQKNDAGKSQAYVSSVLIAKLVQKEFPGVPITLSGHSLGGGEAALASVATGLLAITFNAAGVNPSDYGYSPEAPTSQITNYDVQGEILSKAQNDYFETSTGTKLLPTALGNQINIKPVSFTSYLSNTLGHGMGAVEPAMINYLSKQ